MAFGGACGVGVAVSVVCGEGCVVVWEGMMLVRIGMVMVSLLIMT